MNIAICQSCSMPLRSDKDLGTNADGSPNQDYCHFCYQAGKFTDEGITLEQKIDKLVELAKKMNIPEDRARQMAEINLPNLKRWRKP
ncbi:MAG: zinc ribbon domain-containing protein [bacterium]